MEKLRQVISQYGRWSKLDEQINRIEINIKTDFSLAVEISKSLLETIGKEICKSKNIKIEATASIQSVLKNAFKSIGYSMDDLVTQISSALSTIGQKIGELRNEIGSISHGMPLDELSIRNNSIDEMTKEFLIDSTVLVACFLIRSFENENPRIATVEREKLIYSEQDEFNDFWDENYSEFTMGDYSYQASEILYNIDYPAYETECNAYINKEVDKNNE